MPWLVDYQEWRRHASEFVVRLCSHRARMAECNERHFKALEQQVIANAANLSTVKSVNGDLRDQLAANYADMSNMRDTLQQQQLYIRQLSQDMKQHQQHHKRLEADHSRAVRQLNAARDEINRMRGQLTQLNANFQTLQELAVLHPSSVIPSGSGRVQRTHLRKPASTVTGSKEGYRCDE